jgi:hypothetical protein
VGRGKKRLYFYRKNFFLVRETPKDQDLSPSLPTPLGHIDPLRVFER